MVMIRFIGFKTKAQAIEFINWYSEQGEQDAAVWLELAKSNGAIDVNSIVTVDRIMEQSGSEGVETIDVFLRTGGN